MANCIDPDETVIQFSPLPPTNEKAVKGHITGIKIKMMKLTIKSLLQIIFCCWVIGHLENQIYIFQDHTYRVLV